MTNGAMVIDGVFENQFEFQPPFPSLYSWSTVRATNFVLFHLFSQPLNLMKSSITSLHLSISQQVWYWLLKYMQNSIRIFFCSVFCFIGIAPFSYVWTLAVIHLKIRLSLFQTLCCSIPQTPLTHHQIFAQMLHLFNHHLVSQFRNLLIIFDYVLLQPNYQSQSPNFPFQLTDFLVFIHSTTFAPNKVSLILCNQSQTIQSYSNSFFQLLVKFLNFLISHSWSQSANLH